jgi:hypothetical protein
MRGKWGMGKHSMQTVIHREFASARYLNALRSGSTSFDAKWVIDWSQLASAQMLSHSLTLLVHDRHCRKMPYFSDADENDSHGLHTLQ